MIHVTKLSKTFVVHKKAPGFLGSLRALVRRQRVINDAVREVSFDIGEGEIVGLVGANGAGKTTLVKMLAGIIHPTSGDAQVLGYRPWQRDNRLRRRMALIMGQKAQLWWDLPAADCFLLLREIYQVPPERFQRTLAHLQEVLGVGQLMHIQVRRLSLGERMKMELIAALLHEPRVVYLDEPTIGLDITAQRAIREFVLHYQREFRPAMILTSHYMEDIEQLCRRILIMRNGELVYDGPLARVVEEFATHKVLTAHFRPGEAVPAAGTFDHGLGDVLEQTDGFIKAKVPRAAVARSAAEILRRYPVADLSIEETDIGTIIEGLMGSRSDSAARSTT
ncbi:MAG: ATP-binding cassette domain-containing protein [Planctomycetota bacterium]